MPGHFVATVDMNKIMAYENGDLSENEVIDLFGDLVKTRLAWQLQGAYGRAATALIENGFLDRDGNVLAYVDENDDEEDDEDEDTYSASYNPVTGQWDEIVLF